MRNFDVSRLPIMPVEFDCGMVAENKYECSGYEKKTVRFIAKLNLRVVPKCIQGARTDTTLSLHARGVYYCRSQYVTLASDNHRVQQYHREVMYTTAFEHLPTPCSRTQYNRSTSFLIRSKLSMKTNSKFVWNGFWCLQRFTQWKNSWGVRIK